MYRIIKDGCIVEVDTLVEFCDALTLFAAVPIPPEVAEQAGLADKRRRHS